MGKAGELIARLKDYSFGPFLPDCVREVMRQAATLLASQEAEIEAMRKENFALAAGICPHMYGDEYGNQRCSAIDKAEARALAAEARVAEESQASRDLLAERRRQVDAEGWTPEHDDEHSNGEMARAAGIYAAVAGADATNYRNARDGYALGDYHEAMMNLWPWCRSWFKPTDRRHDLVKAGALILAEIERLDRTQKDNLHAK